MTNRSCVAALALVAAAGSANAQGAASPTEPSASGPTTLQFVPVRDRPGALLIGAHAGAWPSGSSISVPAPIIGGLDLRRLSVVEIAPEGGVRGGPPTRAHHALSFGSDTVRGAVRSLGLDASDCATQFRMPSRYRSGMAAGAASFDVQAQIRLACRF